MSAVTRHLSRAGRIVREVLLTCAALAGTVCIVLAILAFTGGYSLIMFKTGSMSPTIPAGSVALVQKVPAADLHVGDVVTVDRDDALPITHRITSIGEGGSPSERVLTMRGDANATDDPLPYTVTEVRIVRGSVPHLAPAIAQLGNPWVLGGLTIGAALLVSWAFWPRRATRRDADAVAGAHPRAEAPDPESGESDEGDPARTAPGGSTRRTLVVILVAGATLVPAWTLAAEPAAAAPYLVMRSDLEGAGVQQLDPIEPLYWHVDVDAGAAPADGDLDVAFSSTGDPAFRLAAEVRSCASAWASDGRCAADESLLFPRAPLPADGVWRGLWASTTPGTVHLRIALTADPVDAAAGDAGASVTIRATAAGETADSGVDGGADLPATGGTSLALFAAPAAVLIGIGVALVARRRVGRPA